MSERDIERVCDKLYPIDRICRSDLAPLSRCIIQIDKNLGCKEYLSKIEKRLREKKLALDKLFYL